MLLQGLVHHVLKDSHGSRSGAVVINPSARLARVLSVAWLCSSSVTSYLLTTSASMGTEGVWSGVPDRLPFVGSATWLPNRLVSSWESSMWQGVRPIPHGGARSGGICG